MKRALRVFDSGWGWLLLSTSAGMFLIAWLPDWMGFHHRLPLLIAVLVSSGLFSLGICCSARRDALPPTTEIEPEPGPAAFRCAWHPLYFGTEQWMDVEGRNVPAPPDRSHGGAAAPPYRRSDGMCARCRDEFRRSHRLISKPATTAPSESGQAVDAQGRVNKTPGNKPLMRNPREEAQPKLTAPFSPNEGQPTYQVTPSCHADAVV